MKLVKRLIAICCAAIMAVSAAACGANVDSRTEITVWSWEPSMKQVIASFEKENPDIHVIWKNTSGYDNLNNAIQDGYGIPDVVQLEYYALRQYAVSGQLVAITGRTEGYGDFYTPGTWASVQLNGRVYGLPMDSGPMAFFYNDSVFEQVGIDASKIRTWDDYYEAAKKLKSIGVYIAADSGDASFYDTMIWLAGGRPFSTSNDGKNVTINLTDDEGTRTFTEFWQKMIDEGLVATNLTTWSDGWKEAVGRGRSPPCSPVLGCRRCSCRTFPEPRVCGVWHRCPRRMAVIPRRKTAVRRWLCCSVRASPKRHIVSSNTHAITRKASKPVWTAVRSPPITSRCLIGNSCAKPP